MTATDKAAIPMTESLFTYFANMTKGFVQKMRSILVGRGMLKKRERRSPGADSQSSGARSLPTTPGLLLNDDISPDVANKVYNDFEQKIPDLEIAKKYRLRAPQVVVLKKEWMQLKDLEYLDKMYDCYGKDGSRDIVWLCYYIKDQKMRPKECVNLCKEIPDLLEHKGQLQRDIEGQLEKKQELSSQVEPLEERVSNLQFTIDEQVREKAALQNEIHTMQDQSNRLNALVACVFDMKKNLQADAIRIIKPKAVQAVKDILDK